MESTNQYCEALGIDVPHLADLAGHADANTYALLLVALLEKGGPLTLQDAARRFADGGVGSLETVLRSLKRCRPDRPPVYRHGDDCHLDPFDQELTWWAFRLGVRRPSGNWLDAGATPAELEERRRRFDERVKRKAVHLASLRRAVIRAFPSEAPEALALLDVDEGRVERFAGGQPGRGAGVPGRVRRSRRRERSPDPAWPGYRRRHAEAPRAPPPAEDDQGQQPWRRA